jgi:hypothetical protein
LTCPTYDSGQQGAESCDAYLLSVNPSCPRAAELQTLCLEASQQYCPNTPESDGRTGILVCGEEQPNFNDTYNTIHWLATDDGELTQWCIEQGVDSCCWSDANSGNIPDVQAGFGKACTEWACSGLPLDIFFAQNPDKPKPPSRPLNLPSSGICGKKIVDARAAGGAYATLQTDRMASNECRRCCLGKKNEFMEGLDETDPEFAAKSIQINQQWWPNCNKMCKTVAREQTLAQDAGKLCLEQILSNNYTMRFDMTENPDLAAKCQDCCDDRATPAPGIIPFYPGAPTGELRAECRRYCNLTGKPLRQAKNDMYDRAWNRGNDCKSYAGPIPTLGGTKCEYCCNQGVRDFKDHLPFQGITDLPDPEWEPFSTPTNPYDAEECIRICEAPTLTPPKRD